uniref:Uncharacterized protein n=1 Tax=Anguilla anguilla TaxID=7936 RepID=A0A0E9T878_ANGAN
MDFQTMFVEMLFVPYCCSRFVQVPIFSYKACISVGYLANCFLMQKFLSCCIPIIS